MQSPAIYAAVGLRIPLRALSGLADIAGTIDRRAAQLLQAVLALQAPLERIDGKMGVLDQSVNDRLDAVRADFEAGIGGVDQRLLAMLPVLEGMAAHVEESARLLPDPSDGPLARLRHTLTPS